MQRFGAVVSALAVLLCGLAASTHGIKLNKFMVKYGVVPKINSFFDMPRTVDAALAEGNWAIANDVRDSKGYSVWCRDSDYRVCVLFDLKNSVAGIQVSHSVADIQATGVPQDYSTLPDWTSQTVLGTPVYSAIAFFEDPATLPNGGRNMAESTSTAQGIWVQQSDGTNMKIPFNASELASTTTYTRQGCLPAQGLHYFRALTNTSTCAERGPYYMLYEANKGTMLGFGVIIFGRTSQRSWPHRQWFINPPYLVANLVTPNGPACTMEWMRQYGSTSLHVFFREEPWLTTCTALGTIVDATVDAISTSNERLRNFTQSFFG